MFVDAKFTGAVVSTSLFQLLSSYCSSGRTTLAHQNEEIYFSVIVIMRHVDFQIFVIYEFKFAVIAVLRHVCNFKYYQQHLKKIPSYTSHFIFFLLLFTAMWNRITTSQEAKKEKETTFLFVFLQILFVHDERFFCHLSFYGRVESQCDADAISKSYFTLC